MSKYICKDGTEVTITHTMADGSIRESVDGYKIPVNEKTKPLYHLLAKIIDKTS